MDLITLKNKIISFHENWYTKMCRQEGGQLVIKSPFYDNNGVEFKFVCAEGPNDTIKLSITHPLVQFFLNSSLLGDAAEKVGFKVSDKTVYKFVEPESVVDTMNALIEFMYCGQFMMRLVAAAKMIEDNANLEGEVETNE